MQMTWKESKTQGPSLCLDAAAADGGGHGGGDNSDGDDGNG